MTTTARISAPAGYSNTNWPHILDNSGHFFDKSAMRFFGSRIAWATLTATANEIQLFITSEQRDYNSPRLYTLRGWTQSHGVETLSDFQEYATYADAVRALKRAKQLLNAFATANFAPVDLTTN